MSLKLAKSVVFAAVTAWITLTPGVKAASVGQLSTRATNNTVCDTSHAAPFWGAYSANKTDHYYTTDYAEANSTIAEGYEIQGRLGFIYREATESTSIFLRLYNPTEPDHFYTVSTSEADNVIRDQGYSDYGNVGYIYTSNICGSVPLYQLFSSGETDHFYTVNETEAQEYTERGYTLQGIAGYILPNL